MLKPFLKFLVGCSIALSVVQFGLAAEPTMRLRLKDGSFSAGTIVGVEHDDQIGWSSSAFERPFQFDVSAIRSLTRMVDGSAPEERDAKDGQIVFDPPSDPEQPIQFFEMLGGSAVVGRLLDMDDAWLTVHSPSLGTIHLAREHTVAIIDAGYAGQVVYSGPIDDDRWQRLSDARDWEFEAGALVARRPGATIVGNVELPAKAQINLSLSWTGTPDFVLSLGTLASNKVSKVEEVPSAARVEVWANQLALVREVDGGADIAMLAELTPINPRIDLCLYLDQETGTVVACDAHGRPLETLKVAGANPTVRSSVHLANSGPSLTIERFEVRQWDGVVATASEAGERNTILDTAGSRRQGQIVGFDATSGELRIALADGQEQRMPLGELRRGDLTPKTNPQPESTQLETPALESDLPGEQGNGSPNAFPPAVVQPPELETEDGDSGLSTNVEASSGLDETVKPEVESNDTPQSLELVLMDRTRLKGRCLASTESNVLRFEAGGVRDSLSIPVVAVRGLIGNSERYVADVVEQPLGTLKSDEQQLYGYLAATSEGTGSQALVWHPQGSFNGSPLSPQASGSISYRKPLPSPVLGAALEQSAPQPQRIIAPAVGIFLGLRGAAAKADNADANAGDASDKTGDKSTSRPLPEAREILFRTGDAVDGIVEQIDESGMRFRSSQTDTPFVPHELIQHVWLNKKRGVAETSPEKLKRLMTVPRSMKKDPPTHLFIAVNGDYLRGRLVSLQGEILTVEIRLETVVLQTSQIAQIVWLHDRDWSEKESKGAGLTKDETQTEETPEAESSDAKPNAAENDEKKTEPGEIETTEVENENIARDFLVHAIGRTERGLTFQPQQMTNSVLTGNSDLLGQCSIAIDDVNQLLFGRDVTAQVRAYREDPWTLSLAQLPRVYMDDGGDASSGTAGGASPLVGLPATDFTLKTLSGEAFHLSQNRDRVVVLDFWASWCGPCVQTMPLVEEAVGELGADKVQLVAVNIQETAARAQAAVDRLKMTSTVLLDSDGQTAAAYAANAIPQTVIIDRAGKVTHVFVGGGPKFVAQFKQALAAVVETADVGSIEAGFEAAGATPTE